MQASAAKILPHILVNQQHFFACVQQLKSGDHAGQAAACNKHFCLIFIVSQATDACFYQMQSIE